MCTIFFPAKIDPVVVLSLLIIGMWGAQTATSQYFGDKLYSHYVRGSALYIFGWVSVALHEVSHAIVTIIFGGKIKEIHIDTHEGHVMPEYGNDTSFRTWCGWVFGGLAPAYFFPAILLLLWFVVVGMKLDLPYKPLTVDMYTPFSHFMSLGFINFFYWIVTSYANPLMYIFMYFFVTSSIAAGPSLIRKKGEWSGDWTVVLWAVKAMPRHTIVFILAFLLTVSLVALLDYNMVVDFFGFWMLLFILIFISQIIALVFTRLTLAQGIGLIILAIVVNVVAGYLLTDFVPALKQWQCSINHNYC